MTKLRLMNLIRRQDYYRPMLRAIEDCGGSFTIAPGRGHAILMLHLGERAIRIALPTSPSTRSRHGAAQYIPAEIRRAARSPAPHTPEISDDR
jgi:hypothetical protein